MVASEAGTNKHSSSPAVQITTNAGRGVGAFKMIQLASVIALIGIGGASAWATSVTKPLDFPKELVRLAAAPAGLTAWWRSQPWPSAAGSVRDQAKFEGQFKTNAEGRFNQRGYGFVPAFDELHVSAGLPHGAEGDELIAVPGALPWVKKVGGAVPWMKKVWSDNDGTPISIFRTCSLAFLVAFVSFPALSHFLSGSSELQAAVSAGLVPAIGTLYGTMQAFTISLLTERKRAIQVAVGQECAALSLLARHSIDLYRTYHVDNVTMTRALRPLWDHSTTLICKTRGEELLDLVEADPCYRALRVNTEIQNDALKRQSILRAQVTMERPYDMALERSRMLLAISEVRLNEFYALISKLSDLRAVRLSQESFPLPSVVFFFLGVLGGILAYSFALLTTPAIKFKALAYAAASASATSTSWLNPLFSLDYFMTHVLVMPRFLFALLVACLTLVGDFSRDMNRPFTGIYQVKRAVPTSMLLQVRKAILDALPESEHKSLMRGDKLSARIATIKKLKYPVVASLLGSDDVVFSNAKSESEQISKIIVNIPKPL